MLFRSTRGPRMRSPVDARPRQLASSSGRRGGRGVQLGDLARAHDAGGGADQLAYLVRAVPVANPGCAEPLEVDDTLLGQLAGHEHLATQDELGRRVAEASAERRHRERASRHVRCLRKACSSRTRRGWHRRET